MTIYRIRRTTLLSAIRVARVAGNAVQLLHLRRELSALRDCRALVSR